MTAKELGDIPAYPVPNNTKSWHLGLTKREAIAKDALAGMLADPNCTNKPHATLSEWQKEIARQATQLADALLEQLAKTNDQPKT